jgi:hypothetical protein
MFSRMAVAVLAYALSSVGILMMFKLMSEELGKQGWPNVFIFVWLVAWFTHVVMTVAWVRNNKLSRVWPVVGTLAGIGSFLIWPFVAAEKAVLFSVNIAAKTSLTFMAIQAVLVAPCILLVISLVRFHSKTIAPGPSVPAVSNDT